MIPDGDILKFTKHFSYGVSMVAGGVINWIANNMIRQIEARKEDLRQIKTGVTSLNEPKWIWVTMMNRTNGYSRLLAVRRKYNAAVEEVLAEKRNHYILDVSMAMCDPSNFMLQNELTPQGRITF